MAFQVNNGLPPENESVVVSKRPERMVQPKETTNQTQQPVSNVFNEPEAAADPVSEPPVSTEPENMFNDVKEGAQDPDQMVPLRELQEKIGKVKHSKDKQIRELQSQVVQQQQAMSQIQNQYGQQAVEGAQQNINNATGRMPTADEVLAHIESKANQKVRETKILEMIKPAADKYDDFEAVTTALPWSEGMVMVTQKLPDAGEFIYHLSNKAPDVVREIANASSGEERGMLIKKYMDMWQKRTGKVAQASPGERKVIGKAAAPPQQVNSRSAGVGTFDERSYEAAKRRTGRFR